jgi:hypothetical protein
VRVASTSFSFDLYLARPGALRLGDANFELAHSAGASPQEALAFTLLELSGDHQLRVANVHIHSPERVAAWSGLMRSSHDDLPRGGVSSGGLVP